MAGTVAGGKLAAEINKQLYGDDFYKTIGRAGGIVKVPKGFAIMDKEKASEAGKKGGAISKRGPNKKRD